MDAQFDAARKRTSAELSALQESHEDLQTPTSKTPTLPPPPALPSPPLNKRLLSLLASCTLNRPPLNPSLAREIHASNRGWMNYARKQKYGFTVSPMNTTRLSLGDGLKRGVGYLHKLQSTNSHMNTEHLSRSYESRTGLCG